MRTIVWYREHDLRIADHAPLRRALAEGEVVPVFVLPAARIRRGWQTQAPFRAQVLGEAIEGLDRGLRERGSELVLLEGDPAEQIQAMVQQWGVDQVVGHRSVDPHQRKVEEELGDSLGERLVLFEGTTLRALGSLRTRGGQPYSVFTPFARAHRATTQVGVPLATPHRLPALPQEVLASSPGRVDAAELGGRPRNGALIPAGERAARRRLRAFLAGAAARYDIDRDRMDLPGCSRVSVDLRLGALSPRAVWRAVMASDLPESARRAFTNQLLWREFCYSTLFDRPELLDTTFRRDFGGFPWREDASAWRAWVQGETGYPVVDAAARQLLAEGHVHNRARMIAASFLTKHLMISYVHGEAHYMQHLCDGDWAQNNAGWQWSAGCGCDAQPYFRVFNPTLQGKKFDPQGDYVRRWVPELARMPARWIHEPAAAPEHVLIEAHVRIGEDYPRPLVEHRVARERFLEAAKLHLRSNLA